MQLCLPGVPRRGRSSQRNPPLCTLRFRVELLTRRVTVRSEFIPLTTHPGNTAELPRRGIAPSPEKKLHSYLLWHWRHRAVPLALAHRRNG